MSFKIIENSHGKGRVRLVKVTRDANGQQHIFQVNVQLLLDGDIMESAFKEANNENIVPTDTVKNTVYCLASMYNFSSIEEFGLLLARHFIAEYPEQVNRVTTRITSDNWVRLSTPSSSSSHPVPHKHAFQRIGPEKRFTVVSAERRPNATNATYSVTSGFTGLEILKTTQSGFTEYHQCRFTSLPPSTDRLLGTAADIDWVYCPGFVAATVAALPARISIAQAGKVPAAPVKALTGPRVIDFNSTYDATHRALVNTFAGPADRGVYSVSMQDTLYKMGVAALKECSSINRIVLAMPNIHNLPFPLEKYGLTNADHTGNHNILYPIDEPHGMIRAVIGRNQIAKL